MMTKNFRLNALANQYAIALYNHITVTNGGNYFMVDAADLQIRVELVDGVSGVRQLIDAYALYTIKEACPQQWESIGITILETCVNAGGLTDAGRRIWQVLVNDMGATMADHYGGKNAKH